MKRFFLAIVVLLIGVGVAYALIPGLFPDTEQFPRVPRMDGTIGGVLTKILSTMNLENYLGDGTVENTEKFVGTSATGYMKNAIPCPPGNIFRAIDASGNPVCAIKNPVILADLGRIVGGSGTVRIYHADGTNTGITTFPFVIQSGDIIDTPTGGEATIIFTDDSLLRLDSDTTIAMDIGEYGSGQQMASILLENGQVWGRILTMTGSYSVGTNNVVAGVRGTSINLAKTGATNVTLAWDAGEEKWIKTLLGTQNSSILHVIDTTLPDYAADVFCSDGRNLKLRKEESLITDGNCPPVVGNANATNIFDTNTWINTNTQKDIGYMITLRTLSGGLGGSSNTLGIPKDAKIAAEIIESTPTLSEIMPLCRTGMYWYGEKFGCHATGALAIADFTRGNMKIYSIVGAPLWANYGGGSFETINTTDYIKNGIFIKPSGGHIMFGKPAIAGLMSGATLSGKTLIINLASPVTGNNKYILYGGTNMQVFKDGSGLWKCNWNGIPAGCGTSLTGTDTNSLKIKIQSNDPFSEVYIGNYKTPFLQSIQNTIKSIVITN